MKPTSQYEVSHAISGGDFEKWPLKAYWHKAAYTYNNQLRVYRNRFGREMPLALSNQLWQKQVDHYCKEKE